MANYTVRIELHDADEEDYSNLHSSMEDAGFVRWIEGEKGTLYKLPTAEYNMVNTEMSRKQVKSIAVQVAASVKPYPEPWVLVSESKRRTWAGLERW